jgi:hypothetical protein
MLKSFVSPDRYWLTEKTNPPHPLAPSPTRGEGEQEDKIKDSSSPLPFWERGWG